MKEIYMKVAQALVQTYGKKEGVETFEEFVDEILLNKENPKTILNALVYKSKVWYFIIN